MSLNRIFDRGDGECIESNKFAMHSLRICDSASIPAITDVDTINGIPYPPGGGFLPVPVANRFLRTNNLAVAQWQPFVINDIPVGLDGQVLTTTAGTPIWATPMSAPIVPGNPRQVYQTSADGTVAEWTDDVQVNDDLDVLGTSTFGGNGLFQTDLQVSNDLNVLNGDLTVANGNVIITLGNLTVANGVSSLQGNVGLGNGLGDLISVIGDLSFNGSSGATGNILVKTAPNNQGWQAPSFAPTAIQPGASNQVFVTNGAATASTWSNNLFLPGNLGVLGTSQLVGNISLATGGNTIDILGNLLTNGAAGAVGNILTKTGVATQAWQAPSFPASAIQPGTNNQILVTDASGTNALFASSINVPSNLTVNGTTTLNGNLDTKGNTTIGDASADNVNFIANFQCNGVSGTNGQVLTKTGALTQAWATPTVLASGVLGGAVNQVFQSNGTNGVFNSNVTIPGTFTATGNALFNSAFTTSAVTTSTFGGSSIFNGSIITNATTTLGSAPAVQVNIGGNLLNNGNAGLTGQSLVKTSANTQDWRYINDIALRAASTTGPNLYQATPTNIVFNSLNYNRNSGITVGGGGATYTATIAGVYSIYFNTTTSTTLSNVLIQIYVNAVGFGSAQSIQIALNTSPQNITIFDQLVLAIGDVVTVKSQQIAGGGPVNASATNTYLTLALQ